MHLPKNWSEISVSKYRELIEIRESVTSLYDRMIEELSLLYDISPDDPYLEEMSVDTLYSQLEEIKWLRSDPTGLKNNIGDYKLKPINTINIGEWIELDHYQSSGGVANIHYIAAVLFKKERTDEWGEFHMEIRDYDLEKRANYFNELPITDIYGIYDYWIKFKSSILKDYDSIWKNMDDTIEGEDQLDPQEVIEIKKEIEKEKQMANFSWERIIHGCTNGDITKTDQFLKLNCIYVFNWLGMLKTIN
jgi:hypothetical protein